jgi:hypothetical protein
MRRTANGRPVRPLPGAPLRPDVPALTTTPQTSDAQQRKVRRSTRLIPMGMTFRLQ